VSAAPRYGLEFSCFIFKAAASKVVTWAAINPSFVS
jgi:hypothetical protein